MPSNELGPDWETPEPSEHPYMDETEWTLPGWPGFRNRPGRSGLDYLETEFELAHMEGRFVRSLITFSLRTTEPIYLALMLIFGGFSLFLGLLPVFEFISGGFVFPMAWIVCLAPTAVGVIFLVNFALNLKVLKSPPPEDDSADAPE